MSDTLSNNAASGPSRGIATWVEQDRSSLKGKERAYEAMSVIDEETALVAPLGAKALAAITGAVTTSLLMTPFDVLKTRMQTVQSCREASTRIIPLGDNACCQTAVLPQTITSSAALRRQMPGSLPSAPQTCLTSTLPARSSVVASSTTSTPSGLASWLARSRLAQAIAPPKGCNQPSKWAGIFGERISHNEAQHIERFAYAGSSSAGGGGMTGGLTLDAATLEALNAERMATGARAVENGFWREVAVVIRSDGVSGLWKGVGTSLTMSIPSAAIYMIGYEHLLSLLTPHLSPQVPTLDVNSSMRYAPPSNTLSTIPSSTSQPYLNATPLIAGGLARTLSATVISPMELFRTRLQALPAAGQASPTYRSTFEAVSQMVRQQGPQALWRGLGPTLWRDVPFSALYWAGFESIKKYLRESQNMQAGLSTTFISGALSGTCASLVTSPFDVLKTRRQVFTIPQSTTGTASAIPRATWPLLMHIVKNEGWKALFAGVVPRTAKVAPACGLMIGCYEGVGRYLGGEQGSRL